MSAPATIPFVSASDAPPVAGREWSPSDRDRLVFQWVKFEGKTQSWVAEQLELNQSSVSRMIERYERWIARGGPARQGGLSQAERARAQRWLTYERNEWILTSALRIAGEMEHAIDTSKSTITRSAASPSGEAEVRTHHERIDRSAIAARYLRLAYRVNMDQLKLVEQEPLEDLAPLTAQDVGEDDLPAVATESRVGCAHQQSLESRVGRAHQDVSVDDGHSPPNALIVETTSAMHGTHNPPASESSVTSREPDSYDDFSSPEELAAHAYDVAFISPEGMDSDELADEQICLPPRFESVALATASRVLENNEEACLSSSAQAEVFGLPLSELLKLKPRASNLTHQASRLTPQTLPPLPDPH